ncbi:hypothetical protein LDENG_00238730%2C partial [Xyrichtys novacula]|uniref:Peptidase A2 domain-containing protein n=1 Tax=Xyrichtys novacula TaxID=13765 RepID=A0AAV1FAK1_XYRNO|nr:hypothetical protein LDENG_00238730%2C partial [Xyrichtys novacula]
MAEHQEASWQLFSEELRHALTTLTQPLLPGYVDEANRTDNNGLQTVLNEVIDWVTQHPPKEKEIPKALARLACVMSVQIKRQDEAMGRAQEQIRAQMKEIDHLKEELGGTERALQQTRDRLDEMQAEPPSQHDQDPSLVTQISDLRDTIEEKEAQLSDARSTVLEQLQELSRVKSNLDQSSTDARDWKARFESKRVALEAEERHSANLKQMLLETQRKLTVGQPQQDQSGRSSLEEVSRCSCFAKQRHTQSKKAEPGTVLAVDTRSMPLDLEGGAVGAHSDAPQTATARPTQNLKTSRYQPADKGMGLTLEGMTPIGPTDLTTGGGETGQIVMAHAENETQSDLTRSFSQHFLTKRWVQRPNQTLPRRVVDLKVDLRDDTSEPNMMPVQQTAVQEDVCMSLQESVTPSPANTPADLEPRDNTSQETTSTSAVLVVQANSAEEPAEEDSSLILLEPPFLQFLCNLTEKGIAQKFYINTVLENELQHEALLDTAADITLMSSTLFNRLRNMVQQSNRDIKLQPCAMEIRPYSTDSTTLKTMTMLNISIGPMKIMHPVYVSPLESIPFLIGQDLLKRFEPLIDYRQLKIWAQVRRPLPIPATDKNRAQCYALTRELATSTPTSVSSPEQPYLIDDEPQPCSWPFDDSVIKRDTFLCKFDDTNGPDTPGPLITDGINLNEYHVNNVILALWADKSAISRELYDALSRDDPNLQCVRKAFRFPWTPFLKPP